MPTCLLMVDPFHPQHVPIVADIRNHVVCSSGPQDTVRSSLTSHRNASKRAASHRLQLLDCAAWVLNTPKVTLIDRWNTSTNEQTILIQHDHLCRLLLLLLLQLLLRLLLLLRTEWGTFGPVLLLPFKQNPIGSMKLLLPVGF